MRPASLAASTLRGRCRKNVMSHDVEKCVSTAQARAKISCCGVVQTLSTQSELSARAAIAMNPPKQGSWFCLK